MAAARPLKRNKPNRGEPPNGDIEKCRQFEGKKVIVVFVKRRASLVLPDKDMDLGELGPDDNIQIFSQITPQGRTWAPKYRRKQIEPNELGMASKIGNSANYQRDDLRTRCAQFTDICER